MQMYPIKEYVVIDGQGMPLGFIFNQTSGHISYYDTNIPLLYDNKSVAEIVASMHNGKVAEINSHMTF